MEDRLKKLIFKYLGIPEENIRGTSRFKEDFGANDAHSVGLIMAIENRFGVNFTDAEMEKMKTFQEALDLLSSVLAEKRNRCLIY